jgi:hypothetical protein
VSFLLRDWKTFEAIICICHFPVKAPNDSF